MTLSRRVLIHAVLAGAAAGLMAGCATLNASPAPHIDLAGIESLQGEGFELRFLLKLRVQNRSDVDLTYDGIWTELDLNEQTLASGAAPLKGVVPRYGETVLALPVTASGLSLARQVVRWVREAEGSAAPGPVRYALRGGLGGTGFNAAGLGGLRFESRGEIDLRAR